MHIKKKFRFPLPFLRATNVENFLSYIRIMPVWIIFKEFNTVVLHCMYHVAPCFFILKYFSILSLLLFFFHDYIVFLEGKFLEANMSCRRDVLCFQFAGCYKKLVAMYTSSKYTQAYLFLKTCDSLKQMILCWIQPLTWLPETHLPARCLALRPVRVGIYLSSH